MNLLYYSIIHYFLFSSKDFLRYVNWSYFINYNIKYTIVELNKPVSAVINLYRLLTGHQYKVYSLQFIIYSFWFLELSTAEGI